MLKRKTTAKKRRSKTTDCPPKSIFFGCAACPTLWLATAITSKSQPPSPRDAGMAISYPIWVLATFRWGVSIVTWIVKIKIKECLS